MRARGGATRGGGTTVRNVNETPLKPNAQMFFKSQHRRLVLARGDHERRDDCLLTHLSLDLLADLVGDGGMPDHYMAGSSSSLPLSSRVMPTSAATSTAAALSAAGSASLSS